MGDTTETGRKTSFWHFLSNNKIKIPIIQRDYAQGRFDEENIREQFIQYLKEALESHDDEPRILDFVYGSKNLDSILPLDGQQRLTTLWLLHWYIALKKETPITEDEKNVFLKFTYETRESSRLFTQNLVKLLEQGCKPNDISIFITKKLWFLKDWNNDQTVTSMLNMLDYISSVFCDAPLDNYWQNLTGNKAPIMFYELKLEKLGLTDDLYIKMNARGKALTNFENFKADLVGFLKEKDEEYSDAISLKMDTTWTDLFWKNKSKNYHIDEIYFAFLNRYFLNDWIVEYSTKSDDIDKDLKLQSLLYGSNQRKGNKKEINDSRITYGKFDVYREILTLHPEIIAQLEKTLDNFIAFLEQNDNSNKKLQDIQKLFFPNWDNKSKFRFIPDYSRDDNGNEIEITDFGKNKILSIQTIDQMERPVFFAICKYFEYGKYEQVSFNQWMRFSWNLISDPRLRDTNAMIQAMKKINEFVNVSHSIYNQLAQIDITNLPSGTALTDQFIEECEKAKAILTDNKLETKIINAEKKAFFKGQIRFLFKDENKQINWKLFDRKSINVDKYFNKEGIKSVRTITHFISHFTTWQQLLENFKISKKASCWKEILINNKYTVPVHNLLMNFDENCLRSNFSSKIDNCNQEWVDFVKNVQHELCNEVFLQFICSGNDMDSERRHPTVHWWGNRRVELYQENAHADWKKILLGMNRNSILSSLYSGSSEEECQNNKIISGNKIESIPFFWGRDIEFFYKSKTNKEGNWYKWTQENKLLKWNGTTYPTTGKNVINVSNISTSKELLNKLEN
ncbi:MAG: DUF262 domain-containing protein [Treponema sp.]|nr:DUF262 domain-containing protein [Treponema sp.]